jgi:serine/threonine-protein kinase
LKSRFVSANEIDSKLGTVVAGYRLEERLGAGGMGVVYGATRVADGERVAMKFLHASFAAVSDLVKRFEREAAAMRRMQHPTLVAILDAGVASGVPFLVMERLAGRSLGDVLERGALPPHRAKKIALQILEGVAAAHASGVVHRDLKPDNIFLIDDAEEHVKILDFGLAKIVRDGVAGGSVLTHAGLALGTPSYMSPEQSRGERADHRSDLYAVGVILYQMVVGKKPFVAESPLSILRMQIEDTPPPPRVAALASGNDAIDERLELAILRALEKDPAARWPDAAAFMRALDEEEHTRRAKRAPGASTSPVPATQSPLVALASLGLVALVALVVWSSRARTAPAPSVVETRVEPPAPPGAEPTRDDDDADDEVTAPSDTPGAKLEAASSARSDAPKVASLEEASALVQDGRPDEALQILFRLRRLDPRRAEVALWLGHSYFRKLWRTDALREYKVALQARPGLRRDPLLLRNAVIGLEDPTYRLARSLLRTQLGKGALAELRRASQEARNPRLRVRATLLASEIARGRDRRH